MRYEKGRKDATHTRIVEIAAERFRSDGIAATGLAGIMSEAGLTNGAFYPHFSSKAALVRECLSKALEDQSDQLQEIGAGGLEAVIDAYLSAQHRDNPGKGCASAALLPELARAPADVRQLYAERLSDLVGDLSALLPPLAKGREQRTFGIFATLVGALQMARAVEGTEMSDRILEAGKQAARMLAGQPHKSS